MLQINLFTSSTNQSRLPLTKAALYELSNIDDHNKKQIELFIHHNIADEDLWSELAYPLAKSGISVTLVGLHTDTYLDKVRMAHQSTHKYTCKWDDDIYVNRDVWNYMIANRHIVDTPEISMLTPCLSNGMPSVDMFVEDFLNEEETEFAHKQFISDNIPPDIFGCNYEAVYDFIKNTSQWDGKAYWTKVSENDPTHNRSGLPWFYTIVKGVHPARFSYDFNMFLAKHAESNLDKLRRSPDLYLDTTYPTPYLCDNLFISTTQFYIDSQELFFDHWDEGQVNMLSQKRGQNIAYVRNCYGIHMAYGCTQRQKDIEKYYIDNVFTKML